MSNFRFKPQVTSLFAVVAVSALFATGKARAQSMVGSWNMTVSADEKALEKALADVPKDQQPGLNQFLSVMKSTTGTLTVNDDNTYTMTVELSVLGEKHTDKEEGTWTLVKQDGKSIVVETTEKGESKKDTHHITQIDKDNFVETDLKELGPLGKVIKLNYQRKK